MSEFKRWKNIKKSTWALSVFKYHNRELWKMYMSFEMTQKFAYAQFRGKPKSTWDEAANSYFKFEKPLIPKTTPFYIEMVTVKNWSDGLNEFRNWTNLNVLLSMAANLETYIAKVTRLALLSDLGVLFGYENHIDGVHLLKYANGKREIDKLIETYVINFTKGDWNSRLNNLYSIFSKLDKLLLDENISNLEKIRKIRNDIAHSFGRDIEKSQKNLKPERLPITNLNRNNLILFSSYIWKTAKHIDTILMENIGNYEAINAYHEIYSQMNLRQRSAHKNIRAKEFKKHYGHLGASPLSKEFCQELVEYYENL